MVDWRIAALLKDIRKALEGIVQGARIIGEGNMFPSIDVVVELNPDLISKRQRMRLPIRPEERKNKRIRSLRWEALNNEWRGGIE